MNGIISDEQEKEIGIAQQLMFFVTKNLMAVGITAVTGYMVVNFMAIPDYWILIQGYVMKSFFKDEK